MSLPDKWNENFDKNYFENGIKTGTSLYENYRWIPEISFKMACNLMRMYPDKTILDFGCAKGFLVHALRTIGITAYGFDVSRYALENAHPDAKKYLFSPAETLPEIDVVFIKDTLEHIFHDDISEVLKSISKICSQAFIIVPFGEMGSYRIKQYNLDTTHIIIENESWWQKKIQESGFTIKNFSHRVRGFKDNWAHSQYGNGFFQCVSLR